MPLPSPLLPPSPALLRPAPLQFTLWDSAGWAMVPLIAIVAFLLLGIEEIGGEY